MSSAWSLAENVWLTGVNGFRVAVQAELRVDVRLPEGLPELFALPWFQHAPILVLGEGSNTLLVKDVPGAVICIHALERRILHDDGEHALVRIGAGEHWDDVVRWSLGQGLAGLENLALIPGTAGAAPVQNIGAYGTEIREFVDTVEAWDRTTGTLVRLGAQECGFAYRDSRFKHEASRWLVTAVELRLPHHHAPRIDYPGLREELAALGVGDRPRPSEIAEAVSRLRTRKLPNPTLLPNVGSFFRNPQVPLAQAEALREDNPTLPVHTTDNPGLRKLSAAWLIEQAGWKGHRDGDAGVSAQHALVLVNHGQASGLQLFDLARRIAVSVQERFGVSLEPEARIIGADWRV